MNRLGEVGLLLSVPLMHIASLREPSTSFEPCLQNDVRQLPPHLVVLDLQHFQLIHYIVGKTLQAEDDKRLA